MENIFNNFYKNKKVLITGHSGFKGSWLSFWLKNIGADVYGYSLYPETKNNLFEILNIEKIVKGKLENILDYNLFSTFFNEVEPEIVFHLAAQPLVKKSYLEPSLTYQTNIMGTVNLFECIRNSKTVKQVIIVTSDKCYENKETNYAYQESDAMGGYDPYSASKGCVELITSSYRNSFFNLNDFGKKHNVSIASVRAGNVIGGGDWALDRLIPDCVENIIKNKEIILRNPKSIRPWQHVLEPLSGYLNICQKLSENPIKYSGGWNFGPDNKETKIVEELVNLIIKKWEKGSYKVEISNLHEANLLSLDVKKANDILKWKSAYDFDETIDKTVEWYKSFYENNTNMIDLTLKQINNYINKAKNLNIDWSI